MNRIREFHRTSMPVAECAEETLPLHSTLDLGAYYGLLGMTFDLDPPRTESDRGKS